MKPMFSSGDLSYCKIKKVGMFSYKTSTTAKRKQRRQRIPLSEWRWCRCAKTKTLFKYIVGFKLVQPDRWNNKAHKLTWFLQRLTFMAEKATSFENSGIVFFVVNGLSLWMKLRLRQRADVMTLYCYCAAIKQTALPTSKMKLCRPLQIWLLFLQRYNGRKLLFLSRLLMSICWRKNKQTMAKRVLSTKAFKQFSPFVLL